MTFVAGKCNFVVLGKVLQSEMMLLLKVVVNHPFISTGLSFRS